LNIEDVYKINCENILLVREHKLKERTDRKTLFQDMIKHLRDNSDKVRTVRCISGCYLDKLHKIQKMDTIFITLFDRTYYLEVKKEQLSNGAGTPRAALININ
jgi:hypothetical protein